MPLLSIITINRNNAPGLKKTIESVVTQTETDFNDIEYIIIDGNSTDGSKEIIKDFAGNPEYKDKITYWVSEPDTGIYNAMNKGIKKATGDYLHILNSGDYYNGNVLKKIIKELSIKTLDYYLLGVILRKTNEEIEKIETRFNNELKNGSMSHQGIIYKRNLHDLHGLYDEKYTFAADYDFSIKAFYKNNNFKYNTQPLVNFIIGGVGSSEKSIKEIESIKIKFKFLPQTSKINQFAHTFVKPLLPPILYNLVKIIFNLTSRDNKK